MTLVEADWHEARDAARALATPRATERVGLREAVGRTLAEDMHARCSLPPFDTSAMDGWAVAGPSPWRIVGDALAGAPYRATIEPGTCVRIATGAVVPEGTDAVVRSERALVTPGTVAGDSVIDPGTDIRRAGEESAAGELLAMRGMVLTPAHIGLLAAAGHDDAEVAVRPRVVILTLGDELLDHGVPEDGRIRDALGPQLPAWLEAMGAQVTDVHRVDDDPGATRDVLRTSTAANDLVVTTGGTARGPRDGMRAALTGLGELVVDGVRVRPGHPMLLGHLEGVPIVGLPGNPHSALVALMTLAAPIIAAMLGRSDPEARVPAGDDLHGTENGTRLIAGTLVDGAFTGAPFTGSAMLRGLATSTGFALVPPHGAAAGELVMWLPLP